MASKKPQNTQTAKFNEESTAKSDFKLNSKRKSFKPSNAPLKSQDPFDGNTGYKNVYVEHPIQPKVSKPKEVYVPPSDKFDSVSTAKNDFRGDVIPKRKSYKPKGKHSTSDAPFDGSTTASKDFQEYPIPKPVSRKIQEYSKPEGSTDHNTVNKTTYKEHPIHKKVAKKPISANALKGDGQMEKDTNYIKDYPNWEAKRPEKINKPIYIPPEGKMDRDTSNRLDYPGHHGEKRKSFKPAGSALMSDDPFEGYTGYKDTYIEHPVQPKQGRKREEYQPPSEAIDSTSTNKQDYLGITVPKRTSYKRDTDTFKSEEPIDDTTTSGQDYKHYTVERPQIKRQTENLRLEGEMYVDTVNQQTYREFPPQKRSSKRPTSSEALKGSGNFECNTGYNEVYKEHKITPRESTKRNEYVPPEGEFYGNTTSGLDYPAQPVAKRRGFKPIGDALKSDDPFDGYTGYSDTYIEHPIQLKIEKKRDEYKPPEYNMETSTSNKLDYPGHQGQKRKSFKPGADSLKSYVPFDGYTGYKNTYVEHPIQQKHSRKLDEYHPPVDKMETSTSSRLDYLGHCGDKRKSFKQIGDAFKSNDPFDGNTGYKDTYVEYPVQPKQSRKRDEYQPPNDTMEKDTSSRLDYSGHPGEKRKGFKPTRDALKSDDPFEGYTGYKDTYIEHQVQPRQSRKREEYQPPSEAIDSTSTNKQDYLGITVPKRTSYKRDTDTFKSEEPIDGTTTSGQDYKQYKVERPQIKRHTENLRLEGEMYVDTVNQQTYREFPPQKRSSKRPTSSEALKGSGNFENKTGYNEVYKEHKITPRETTKRNEYVPPEGEFYGETTSGLDYSNQPVAKRKSFKPIGNLLKSNEPLECNSVSRDAYAQYTIPPKHVRLKEVYVASTDPMETLSTNKQDFRYVSVPKRESYNRNKKPFTSDEPLDDTTTFNQDFKTWEANRPSIHLQEENIKLEGDMYLNTVNQETFRGENGIKRIIKKPGSSNTLCGDGQFYGSSAYENSFPKWEVEPRQKVYKNQYVAPEGKFCATTTNQVDFQEQPLSKRNKYLPGESYLKSHDPFAPNTGYKDTFIKHSATSRVVREKEKYIPPTVPFETETTNKQDFKNVTTSKRSGFGPPKEPFCSDVPLECNTTAKEDFKQWTASAEKSLIKRQDTYVKPTEPMDLQTTNSLTFRGDSTSKRSATRPKSSNTLKYDGKFHGKSNYRDSFTQRDLPAKIYFKKNQYNPPTVKFEGETTSRIDFTSQLPSKAKSYKTTESALRSSAPMIACSSYNDSFVPLPLALRHKRETQQYVAPSVPFTAVSTNQSDFTGVLGTKRHSYRPSMIVYQTNAPFDSTSTSSSDFKGNGESNKPQRFKPNTDSFLKSNAKFDGRSTYQGNFETGQTASWSGPPTLLVLA